MLDIFIRTPAGSVKINWSYFVLPVVAIETWNIVAVINCAVHTPYLDTSQRLLLGHYKSQISDSGNSFLWSTSKLPRVLLELLYTENKNLPFQPASNVNCLTGAIRGDSLVLNHPGPVLMTVPHDASVRERAHGC